MSVWREHMRSCHAKRSMCCLSIFKEYAWSRSSSFFFFSSRRRHTRLQGDWSSDVCSSDLKQRAALGQDGRIDLGGALRHQAQEHAVLAAFLGDARQRALGRPEAGVLVGRRVDRKSTRLNSSHLVISYAVFCLKKKKKHIHRGDLPCQRLSSRSCRFEDWVRHF